MPEKTLTQKEMDVRSVVRERYGKLAATGQQAHSGCCDPGTVATSCCGSTEQGVQQLVAVTNLYDDPEVTALPVEVTELSLGCGNPVALASLEPGQTVLDLGSGGGIDCFLAARKVGPAGTVIGVDMTPEMVERARANRQKLGVDNVSFRLGEIEHLPVGDNSVDVILSNCVINLSPDKAQTFREAFRVLKPGGQLAITDIVTAGPLPAAIKEDLSAWAGCVGGALEASDYMAEIEAAGFVEVKLTPVYWEEALLEEAVEQMDPAVANTLQEVQTGQDNNVYDTLSRAVFSAQITARKPG